jgi:hypothetical protein
MIETGGDIALEQRSEYVESIVFQIVIGQFSHRNLLMMNQVFYLSRQ